MGELLAEMPKAKGGNPNLSKPTTGCTTLSEIGITRDQSSTWQQSIPSERAGVECGDTSSPAPHFAYRGDRIQEHRHINRCGDFAAQKSGLVYGYPR